MDVSSDPAVMEKFEAHELVPPGNPAPIAAIPYDETYSRWWSALRGVIERGEISDRGAEIAERIIEENPAHFTAWEYRRAWAQKQGCLLSEIDYAAANVQENPKNYQVWHHHRCLVELLEEPMDALQLTEESILEDSKNYHAWSYRMWAVRKFKLFEKELGFSAELLNMDVRNNSAWNYRFFVLKETCMEDKGSLVDSTFAEESATALTRVLLAPNNESAWNFLRAISKLARKPLTTVPDLVPTLQGIVDSDPHNRIAAGLLVEALSGPGGDKTKAADLVRHLMNVDNIRRFYWQSRLEDILKSEQGVGENSPVQ